MQPDPSKDILVYVLWALCGLVVAMGGALVWVIKNNPSRVPRQSGQMSREEWEQIIRGIVSDELSELEASIQKVYQVVHDFQVTRDPQWDHLTRQLESVRQRMHEILDRLQVIVLWVDREMRK